MPAEVTDVLDTVASAAGEAARTVGSAAGDLFHQTSVAEARAQARSELTPVVDDSVLKTPGTLTVGVKTAETAPLSLLGTDGSLSGIDVDTAHALADELGLGNVELVSVQNASSALSTTCDIVMGVKEGESPDVTSVGNYAQSALGVFCSQEVDAPVPLAELSGKTVGVQASSVSQAALGELGAEVAEQTFSNLNEAFDALAAGTVDYVVCDAYAGAYLSCVTGGGHFAGTLDEPVAVGIGVSASSPADFQAQVQGALETIQANGIADIAKSRWVGSFPELTSDTRILGA